MIYLDNAATSYPKPFEVIQTVTEAMSLYGANPGRSGHNLSVNTAMAVYSARMELNEFFDGYGSEYVSFTPNCTYALNLAIKGMVHPGDHVVISSLEHNSVVRPIHTLSERGEITYSVFSVSEEDDETVENFRASLTENTQLAVVTAVSNVFGNILPLAALSRVAQERGVKLCVDGAQGAGVVPLSMEKTGINCLCVPGHKGLLGPMGSGALLHDGSVFGTLIEGGTGSASFSLRQPEEYPERLESGTLSVPAICGMKKGVQLVSSYGVENIFREESGLTEYLFGELATIKGAVLYRDAYCLRNHAPVLSFNIAGLHSEEVASRLNENGVAVRAGYHCAPLAHKAFGTQETGTVRVCPSRFTTKKDINILLNLVQKIAFGENI